MKQIGTSFILYANQNDDYVNFSWKAKYAVAMVVDGVVTDTKIFYCPSRQQNPKNNPQSFIDNFNNSSSRGVGVNYGINAIFQANASVAAAYVYKIGEVINPSKTVAFAEIANYTTKGSHHYVNTSVTTDFGLYPFHQNEKASNISCVDGHIENIKSSKAGMEYVTDVYKSGGLLQAISYDNNRWSSDGKKR
jgi:hypothetical protein